MVVMHVSSDDDIQNNIIGNDYPEVYPHVPASDRPVPRYCWPMCCFQVP